MHTPEVGFLDTWPADVEAALRTLLPRGWTCSFAKSNGTDEAVRIVRTADMVVGGGSRLGRVVMEAAPRLKLIHKFGIGVDKIDLRTAGELGIPVLITAGANAGPVAEHALMLMLAVSRRLPLVDRELRRGNWIKSEMRSVCHQVRRKTVGIVGFGHIGRVLARLLGGFECEVLYHDTRAAEAAVEQELAAARVTLPELLARSDIVSLHTPLNPATSGMIDTNAIRAMKAGAILINTARGELVDETALYDALVSGHLRGAGLDTFAAEPPLAGNPLLTLDQVVVTPHTAGGVIDNVASVGRHIFRNMEAFLAGEALPPEDVVVPPPRRG